MLAVLLLGAATTVSVLYVEKASAMSEQAENHERETADLTKKQQVFTHERWKNDAEKTVVALREMRTACW
ncbi:hypothetical protein [Lentzea sp. NBRC 102530]|uniref:hypothetical protein n=1 Tax=Lentzea sp. NBRC 102530 TaxID=3032201 RepID=UPI0024A030B8|nr:hypothetical protein [Lentzea sp. NBRC 102530]GLY49625.1 hypothetical protein Lesp01_32810 [Lentzea sp. NBRC 102530]